MVVHENQNGLSDAKAVLIGGGSGFVIGAVVGYGLAVLFGAIASGMGWLVMLHAAFAMMLAGGWTAPCFVDRNEGTERGARF